MNTTTQPTNNWTGPIIMPLYQQNFSSRFLMTEGNDGRRAQLQLTESTMLWQPHLQKPTTIREYCGKLGCPGHVWLENPLGDLEPLGVPSCKLSPALQKYYEIKQRMMVDWERSYRDAYAVVDLQPHPFVPPINAERGRPPQHQADVTQPAVPQTSAPAPVQDGRPCAPAQREQQCPAHRSATSMGKQPYRPACPSNLSLVQHAEQHPEMPAGRGLQSQDWVVDILPLRLASDVLPVTRDLSFSCVTLLAQQNAEDMAERGHWEPAEVACTPSSENCSEQSMTRPLAIPVSWSGTNGSLDAPVEGQKPNVGTLGGGLFPDQQHLISLKEQAALYRAAYGRDPPAVVQLATAQLASTQPEQADPSPWELNLTIEQSNPSESTAQEVPVEQQRPYCSRPDVLDEDPIEGPSSGGTVRGVSPIQSPAEFAALVDEICSTSW